MAVKPDWINPDAVRLLLGGLIGKQVPARSGMPLYATPRTPLAIAEYLTDDDQLGGVVYCDLPLAASLGAALSLLPPNTANDAIKANQLPPMLQENCYEVMNVAARLFNSPIRPHVRLVRMFWNQQSVPIPLSQAVRLLPARLDVALVVPGYAQGTISILAA